MVGTEQTVAGTQPSPAVDVSRQRGPIAMLAMLVSFVGLLVAAEGIWAWATARWIAAVSVPAAGTALKMIYVDPDGLYGELPADDRPIVMLVGDSHLYRASGVRGKDVTTPVGHTVLDELAELLVAEDPSRRSASFVRFASGYLPAPGMLGSIGSLLKRGVRPTVVVIAIRPSALVFDDEYYTTSQWLDAELAAWLLPRLTDPRVAAPDAVLARYRAALASSDQPWADRVDRRVTAWLTGSVTLLSGDSGIRFRVGNSRRMAWSLVHVGASLRYPTDAESLERNVATLGVLLRLLDSFGIRRLCYVPPEGLRAARAFKVFVNSEVSKRVQMLAADAGCPLLDASTLLPAGDEWWGWRGNRRDFFHFRPEGHRRLATFLFREGERLGVWDAVEPRP